MDAAAAGLMGSGGASFGAGSGGGGGGGFGAHIEGGGSGSGGGGGRRRVDSHEGEQMQEGAVEGDASGSCCGRFCAWIRTQKCALLAITSALTVLAIAVAAVGLLALLVYLTLPLAASGPLVFVGVSLCNAFLIGTASGYLTGVALNSLARRFR